MLGFVVTIIKLIFGVGWSLYKVMEYLGYGIGLFTYLAGVLFVCKTTYDINTEECRLLGQYYNSWFFTFFIQRRLEQLNPKHTSSYLSEKYYRSKSENDFIGRCSSLRYAGPNTFIIRF